MIKIIEVKNRKDRKEFLNFPLRMYKDNPNFVPPLYADEKKMFTKNSLITILASRLSFSPKKTEKQ